MLFSTDKATYVGFMGPSGGRGLEAKHEPITAALSAAPVKVNLEDGTVKYFDVGGGFLEMNGTKCTVLATVAKETVAAEK